MSDPYVNRRDDDRSSEGAFNNMNEERGAQSPAGEQSFRPVNGSTQEMNPQQANQIPNAPPDSYYVHRSNPYSEVGGPGQNQYYNSYGPYGMPPQDNRVQKKKKHRWLKVVALILCVAIIGSAAGIVSYYAMKDFNRGSGHEDVVGDIGDSDEPGNTAPEEDKTDKPESIVSGKVLTTYTGPGNALTPMEIYDNMLACCGYLNEITGT